MSLASLILPQGMVFIEPSESIQGGQYINSAIRFGVIAAIYETTDFYNVGEYVAFDSSKSTDVIYDNIIYTFIDEKYIYYSEGYPP